MLVVMDDLPFPDWLESIGCPVVSPREVVRYLGNLIGVQV